VKFNFLFVIFCCCSFVFASCFGDVLEVPAQATDESLIYNRKLCHDLFSVLLIKCKKSTKSCPLVFFGFRLISQCNNEGLLLFMLS